MGTKIRVNLFYLLLAMMAVVACVWTSNPLPTTPQREDYRKLATIDELHKRSFLPEEVLKSLSEKEVIDAVLDYMKNFREKGPDA